MMKWTDPDAGAVAGADSVTVNVASRDALLADLGQRLTAGQGFSVATLNLDHIVKLRDRPDFRAAYLRHSHVTADGNPIVWLARLAGQRVEGQRVSLVPGSELIDPIVGLAARAGVAVALFGATEASLAAAGAVLAARHPGLRIAAAIAPPMGFDPQGADADRFIGMLGAAGAGLCLVAFGAPKQELFVAHAGARLPDVGFVSIGAGLDFISGHQVRAPRIVRRLAAEWLWRLAQDPRRLAGRYWGCILVLPGLLGRAVQTRLRTGAGTRNLPGDPS